MFDGLLGLLCQGCCGYGTRLLNAYLLRAGASRLEGSDGLIRLPLSLRYAILIGLNIRRSNLYRSGGGIGRLDGLHILLLSDFLLVHQLLVALHIVLSLGVVRFSLQESGARRSELLF